MDENTNNAPNYHLQTYLYEPLNEKYALFKQVNSWLLPIKFEQVLSCIQNYEKTFIFLILSYKKKNPIKVHASKLDLWTNYSCNQLKHNLIDI